MMWSILFPPQVSQSTRHEVQRSVNEKKNIENDASPSLISCLNAFGSGYVLGGSVPLLFNPDGATIASVSRVSQGSGLFSLAWHVLSPAFLRSNKFQLPSVHSSILAVTAGSFIGAGSSLLCRPREGKYNLLKRILGGAGTVFGLYLWFPVDFRLIWTEIKDVEVPLTTLLQSSVIPITKGAVLGTLVHYMLLSPATNEESTKDDIYIPLSLRGSIGGGFFALGLYLWSPPILRSLFLL